MQSNLNIPNSTGYEFRQNVMKALKTVYETQVSTEEPSETFPGSKWADKGSIPLSTKVRDSVDAVWLNQPSVYQYDSSVFSNVSFVGYKKGDFVSRSDGTGYWFNTVDGNTTDPEAAGAASAGWVPDFTSGVASVTVGGSNIILTPTQYGHPAIFFTGTIAGDINVTFPSFSGEWFVQNGSTGNYTLSVKTASGVAVQIPQNFSGRIYSDGTNIYLGNVALTSKVNVKYYGALGAGGDYTARLQAAFNSGAKRVRIPPGDYGISSYLLVPVGVRIEGEGRIFALNDMPQYVPWATCHQKQMILFLGDKCSISGIELDGQNYNAGGVAVWNGNKPKVYDCNIHNTGASQAILDTVGKKARYKNNDIQYGAHGIQLWQTSDAHVSGNIIDSVDGGGVWTADAYDVSVWGNTISNCGDVGIDFEGGLNCTSWGNNVSACKNGELAFFQNGTGSGIVPANLVHKGNTVHRTATYLAGTTGTPTACNANGGACYVNSMNVGSINITFEENTINCDFGFSFFTEGLVDGKTGLKFVKNTVRSAANLFRIQNAWFSIVEGNTFYGAAGSETLQNEWKNCSGGIFNKNKFIYENAKATNFVVSFYTDSATVTVSPRFTENEFDNCGDLAFRHDGYISNVRCLVSRNRLTEVHTPNGGIAVTNASQPIYLEQQLNLLLVEGDNDLAALTGLKVTGLCAHGVFAVWMGGTVGSRYGIVYTTEQTGLVGIVTSRDGSGSGSGIGASTSRYASFSGSVITIADIDPTYQSTAHLALMCNSYH